MSKLRRVNVIGRGPWGQNIVRTLGELGVEVPVIANRETGWQAAFEQNPDGIVVAAHPSINLPVVLECDKRGLPVFIEKPAALCLADVERMAECKIPIHVDYTYMRGGKSDLASLIAGIASGRRHDFGVLYDWAPHALSLMLHVHEGGQYAEPLKCMLDDFVTGYHWLDFAVTLEIHQIIDAAEKKNAAR